jgi:cyclic dehypoxanthinyl futalosine synthase
VHKKVWRKILAGQRISPSEGLILWREAPFLELAAAARDYRERLIPGNRVTFVWDSNPNYTNICINDCSFCAFWRRAGSSEAFVRLVEELLASFREAACQGVTTILLQGGVNPELPLSYYLNLVRRTVAEVPEVHPHFFSPPEIRGMALAEGLTVTEVLRLLWEAGLRTLPGGGAEILSDRVRKIISPRKGTAADWLMVMREAHRLGFRTTATMMFGHREKPADLIAHLDAIRNLQDEHQGFTAFIPWSFKTPHSPLGKKITRRATGLDYLRHLALARIYLDNFPHVQASPFSEGKKIGQVALHCGADDFGGILREESVHRAAGHINPLEVTEMVDLIRAAGFTAAQRDTHYRILKIYE